MRFRTAVELAARPPLVRALATRLRRSDLRAGLVLVYHGVAEEPLRPPDRQVVPAVSDRTFAAQVQHMAEHYVLVTAGDLPDAVSSRRHGDRFPVALTFDDDLRSHTEIVLPILRARGVPATFFLTGASLTGPHSFWWERLQRVIDREGVPGGGTVRATARTIEALSPAERAAASEALLEQLGGEDTAAGLRAADVRRLTDAGCEVGFHTRRHDTLTMLDDRTLHEQLESGRSELADAAGSPVTSIAYPHGKADDRVAEAAREAGFLAGFTLDHGAVTSGLDPMRYGRLYPRTGSADALEAQLTWHLLRAKTGSR